MSGHFSAFSLVDRITDLESGKRTRGRFQVPANIARFPSTLAAEAVGQLAAWNAIAHLGFQVRPVAGLAAELRFGPLVHPGQSLDLETIIERRIGVKLTEEFQLEPEQSTSAIIVPHPEAKYFIA
jgi:3-hydroxymyristoyl/3-hydroxydecanoyl-(acyl carrier protein) dehydratase